MKWKHDPGEKKRRDGDRPALDECLVVYSLNAERGGKPPRGRFGHLCRPKHQMMSIFSNAPSCLDNRAARFDRNEPNSSYTMFTMVVLAAWEREKKSQRTQSSLRPTRRLEFWHTCRPVVASSGVGARGAKKAKKIRGLRRHPGTSLRHPSSSSGVGAFVVGHGLSEPSEAWLHHFQTESVTRERKNPGKETRGEGGWVLWPAAHLHPKKCPETLTLLPRCFTFLWGCHRDVRDVSFESCGL